LTVFSGGTIIEKPQAKHCMDKRKEDGMIRKLIIIAVLAAIGFVVYRGLDSSDFFGTRGKERKTFEDVEENLFK
jgi:hypothetical protein